LFQVSGLGVTRSLAQRHSLVFVPAARTGRISDLLTSA
jgi:hypothetical protein